MKIYQVDAFANERYKGNPAAICFPTERLSSEDMIQIAMEMNLSETAYLWKKDDDRYDLKWFTPEMEVSLCGHATLASAHVLWSKGLVPEDTSIRFDTLSGELIATKNKEWIVLDFPVGKLENSTGDETLIEALGVQPTQIASDPITYVVEVATPEEVMKCTPNLELLKKAEREEVIVTSKSTDDTYDFVSRFFGPAIGVDEDPATGSAHTYLAPYWAEKLGKTSLIGHQVSKRTGILKCQLKNDRVEISGQCVTVLEGELV